MSLDALVRPVELGLGWAAGLERAERLQDGPRASVVTFRGKRERLANRAATVGTGKPQRPQQRGGLAARVQPQQLEDRGRARDLASEGVAVGNARRRSQPRDRRPRRCGASLYAGAPACVKTWASEPCMRTAFRGSW